MPYRNPEDKRRWQRDYQRKIREAARSSTGEGEIRPRKTLSPPPEFRHLSTEELKRNIERPWIPSIQIPEFISGSRKEIMMAEISGDISRAMFDHGYHVRMASESIQGSTEAPGPEEKRSAQVKTHAPDQESIVIKSKNKKGSVKRE